MNYVVISRHESQYPNPIEFRSGEYVVIGRQNNEFPGWAWVKTRDGNQGWAPSEYLDSNNDRQTAIANHNYSARELNTTNKKPRILSGIILLSESSLPKVVGRFSLNLAGG